MQINKVKYLKELEKLNLPEGEYALWGSAPLVIAGLKESKDLDVLVSSKLWKQLAKEYPVKTFEAGNQLGEYITIGNIDFVNHIIGFSIEECENMIKEASLIDRYRIVSLENIIKWKRILGREKDVLDIAIIEEYLKQESKQ